MMRTSTTKTFLSLLLSVLLVWMTTPGAIAAGPASPPVAPAKPLGALITGGDAQVRGMAVRYETTLFEGDAIKTQGSTARLNLRGGTRVDLTLYSEGTIESIDGVPTLVLKQGVAQFASAAPFAVKIGNLRLLADNSARASVLALGDGTTVTVNSGSVRAVNDQTQQTSQLREGQSLVLGKTGAPLGQVVYAAAPGGGSPRPQGGGGGGGHGTAVAIVAGIAVGVTGIVIGALAKRDASDAEAEAAAARTAAATAQTEAAAARTAAAAAQATATAAAATIASLQASVTSLQAQLTAANARITSLVSSINATSEYAAQLNAALQALAQQQALLNAQVADLAAAQAELAQVQNEIATILAGGVTAGGQAVISPALQALLNRLGALVIRIQTIRTTINTIAARITTILTTLPPPPPAVSP